MFHLNTSKPALVAQIQSSLLVQAGVLTDVNDTVRSGLATTRRSPPRPIRRCDAADTGRGQAVAINRLVNVLRALSKAQWQLVQGLQ